MNVGKGDTCEGGGVDKRDTYEGWDKLDKGGSEMADICGIIIISEA